MLLLICYILNPGLANGMVEKVDKRFHFAHDGGYVWLYVGGKELLVGDGAAYGVAFEAQVVDGGIVYFVAFGWAYEGLGAVERAEGFDECGIVDYLLKVGKVVVYFLPDGFKHWGIGHPYTTAYKAMATGLDM